MVAKQLVEKDQRIDALMGVKNSIVEQRRARNQKEEAGKGKGMMKLQNITPGPADYAVMPSSLLENPAPIISDARPNAAMIKGSIDAAVASTKYNPPPGSYDPKVLPRGGTGWDKAPVSYKAGAKKTSFLDDAAKGKREVPGPGRYDTNKSTMQLEHATKMRRGYVEAAPSAPPAWAKVDSDLPGPAAYAVDAYQRKARLRRARVSLPSI